MEQWTKSIVSRSAVACKSCPDLPVSFPLQIAAKLGDTVDTTP